MPVPNPKNAPLNPASQDLGLGDLLQQQLKDEEEERKKKLMQQQQVGPLGAGMNTPLGAAASSLFGGPGGGSRGMFGGLGR